MVVTFPVNALVPVTANVLLRVTAPFTAIVVVAVTAELILVPPSESNSVVLLDTVNTLLDAFAVKFKPLNVVLPERNRPVEFARVFPPVA